MKKLINHIKAMYYEVKIRQWERRIEKYLHANDYLMARHSIDMRWIYNDRLLEL